MERLYWAAATAAAATALTGESERGLDAWCGCGWLAE